MDNSWMLRRSLRTLKIEPLDDELPAEAASAVSPAAPAPAASSVKRKAAPDFSDSGAPQATPNKRKPKRSEESTVVATPSTTLKTTPGTKTTEKQASGGSAASSSRRTPRASKKASETAESQSEVVGPAGDAVTDVLEVQTPKRGTLTALKSSPGTKTTEKPASQGSTASSIRRTPRASKKTSQASESQSETVDTSENAGTDAPEGPTPKRGSSTASKTSSATKTTEKPASQGSTASSSRRTPRASKKTSQVPESQSETADASEDAGTDAMEGPTTKKGTSTALKTSPGTKTTEKPVSNQKTPRASKKSSQASESQSEVIDPSEDAETNAPKVLTPKRGTSNALKTSPGTKTTVKPVSEGSTASSSRRTPRASKKSSQASENQSEVTDPPADAEIDAPELPTPKRGTSTKRKAPATEIAKSESLTPRPAKQPSRRVSKTQDAPTTSNAAPEAAEDVSASPPPSAEPDDGGSRRRRSSRIVQPSAKKVEAETTPKSVGRPKRKSTIAREQEEEGKKTSRLTVDKTTVSVKDFPDDVVAYFKTPLNWIRATDDEKAAVAEQVRALEIDCPRCEKSFQDETSKHLSECLLPVYYQYMGRAEEFRKLSASEHRTMMLGVIRSRNKVPCLNVVTRNCPHESVSGASLVYHVLRCGVAAENAPWTCWRCKYQGVKTESKDHLAACQTKGKNAEAMAQAMKTSIVCRFLETLPTPEDPEASAYALEAECGRVCSLPDEELVKLATEAADEEPDPDRTQDIVQRLRILLNEERQRSKTYGKRALAKAAAAEDARSSPDGYIRFRIRNNVIAATQCTLWSINEYTSVVRRNFKKFWRSAVDKGFGKALCRPLSQEPSLATSDPDNLDKWLTRSSIRFLVAPKHARVSLGLPPAIAMARSQDGLKIFDSVVLEAGYDAPTKHDLVSKGVNEVISSPVLSDGSDVLVGGSLKAIEKGVSERIHSVQALFCGGPIIAMGVAPCLLPSGEEVFVVSTVVNEVTFDQDPSVPSYLQFWTWQPKKPQEKARLWFLLKVEGVGMVTDVDWCPVVNDVALAAAGKKKELPENLLGWLAVATMSGQLLIYQIPKTLPCLADAIPDPPIIALEPTHRIRHPRVPVIETTATCQTFAAPPADADGEKDVKGDILSNEQPIRSSRRSALRAAQRTREALESEEIVEKQQEEEEKEKQQKQPSSDAENPEIAENVPKKEVDENYEVDGDAEAAVMADDDDFREGRRAREHRQRIERSYAQPIDDVGAREMFIQRIVTEAPLIYVNWSSYGSATKIAVVSLSGWVLVYDLAAENPEKYVDAIYDDGWGSPVAAAQFIDDTLLAITFRDNALIIFRLPEKEVVYSDENKRMLGRLLLKRAPTFPGIAMCDSVRGFSTEPCLPYSAVMYLDIHFDEFTGWIFNAPGKHQGQVMGAALDPLTGIVASVGIDGRLVHAMTGRMQPINTTGDYPCYANRPVLQLIRHTISGNEESAASGAGADDADNEFDNAMDEASETVPSSGSGKWRRKLKHDGRKPQPPADDEDPDETVPPPVIDHDKCVERTCLEFRIGDASIASQAKENATLKIERVSFNRRLEQLSRVAFSSHAPGTSIVGGEAGFVFILPTAL